jgi:hypothetical protein
MFEVARIVMKSCKNDGFSLTFVLVLKMVPTDLV